MGYRAGDRDEGGGEGVVRGAEGERGGAETGAY